jgi:undecaprenyl diphosphate synthase
LIYAAQQLTGKILSRKKLRDRVWKSKSFAETCSFSAQGSLRQDHESRHKIVRVPCRESFAARPKAAPFQTLFRRNLSARFTCSGQAKNSSRAFPDPVRFPSALAGVPFLSIASRFPAVLAFKAKGITLQAKVPAGLDRRETDVYRHLDPERLPKHIAIIMDGNGRWAKRRHMPRVAGHRAGVAAVRSTVETAARVGIHALTLYAFSEENWKKRPKSEVDFLMGLLSRYLKAEVPTLNENNIRLEYIGRQQQLPKDVQERMEWARLSTAHNTGTVLTLALNYSARSELVDAFRSMVNAASQNGGLEHLRIDEDVVGEHLYTRHLPDPDLVVRTSGEMRLSNFLLWQLAYAEIYVTPTLWPDFRGVHLLEAIAEYQKRERRYGGLNHGDAHASGEPVKAHK